MHNNNIDKILTQHGLLCASFAYNDLPQTIKQNIIEAHPSEYDNSFISLLANAGNQFWKAMQSSKELDVLMKADPVDQFSISIAKTLITACGQTDNAQILYPGYPVPLIKLGELAQWSSPSPLGLGIHTEYGPWFAYRALVKTDALLTTPAQKSHLSIDQSDVVSPCLSCADTPCISACPASATSMQKPFDIKRCAGHRLKVNSECKTQCHARNACPVGLTYQYSEEQSEYHMTHALDALEKWASSN